MIRILYILRNFLLESKRIIIWKIYLTNKLLETNFISTKLSSREYLLKFKYTLSNCNCDIISIKNIFFIKKKKIYRIRNHLNHGLGWKTRPTLTSTSAPRSKMLHHWLSATRIACIWTSTLTPFHNQRNQSCSGSMTVHLR